MVLKTLTLLSSYFARSLRIPPPPVIYTTLYFSRLPGSCYCFVYVLFSPSSYVGSRDLVSAVHNQNNQRFLNETNKTWYSWYFGDSVLLHLVYTVAGDIIIFIKDIFIINVYPNLSRSCALERFTNVKIQTHPW